MPTGNDAEWAEAVMRSHILAARDVTMNAASDALAGSSEHRRS